MKILSFAVLDSTSSHAQRMIDAGQGEAPFAILARTQTEGRGRRGRSWLSPEGGIYLTLVLAAEQVGPQAREQLPVSVAVAVCLWCQEEFGLRLTMKWPNDLLFAGAKLGGILCESRFQGTEPGPLLIGIGLNLKHLAISELDEYRVTSIEAALQQASTEDPLVLGERLAWSVMQSFGPRLPPPDPTAFALEPGHLWLDDSGAQALQIASPNGGALHLKPWPDGEVITLNSVHHSWRWFYQQGEARPLWVADVGNSLCKLGYFRDAFSTDLPAERLALRMTDPASSLQNQLRTFLQLDAEGAPLPVHILSVNSAARDRLKSLLADCGRTGIDLPKRPVTVRYQGYAFQQLGIDRIAMIEAAHQQFPGKNLLIVGAGTAVTLDLVDLKSRHRGGYIWAGMQAKLDCMAEKTAQLPSLHLRDFQEPAEALFRLGHDTRAAMLQGVLAETAGAIRSVYSSLEQEFAGSGGLTICLTGGDAHYLAPYLDGEVVEQLVLHGIRIMVLGGALSKR